MRRTVSVFLLATLLIFCPGLRAAQLAVLLGADEPPYREFLASIRNNLQPPWQLAWEGTPDSFQRAPPKVDLILTAGPTATRLALDWAGGPPVMASLITRNTFETIRKAGYPNRQGFSALFLDQPISRQLAFINKLLPPSVLESRQLFVLSSDPHPEFLSALQKNAHSAGFKLTGQRVNNPEEAIPAADRMLGQRNGIFLALPDSVVFARDNIRPFLLTTYRHHIPVIAFSVPFVQAGALAALHTTPAQMGQELAQWILRLPPPPWAGTLPPPREPTQFSVFINGQVARSLKLSVPGEDEILSALSNTGEKQP